MPMETSSSTSMARHDMWDEGYRLTVAEIQLRPCNGGEDRNLVWQDIDRSPDFPVLSAFLRDLPVKAGCTVASTTVRIMDSVTPEDLVAQSISMGRH